MPVHYSKRTLHFHLVMCNFGIGDGSLHTVKAVVFDYQKEEQAFDIFY